MPFAGKGGAVRKPRALRCQFENTP